MKNTTNILSILLYLPSSITFIVIIVLIIFEVRPDLLFSSIFPTKLKANSNDTIDTDTGNTSHANVESTRDVKLWSFHHCNKLKLSSLCSR